MPITTEEQDRITSIIKEVHTMGCAIVIFTPEDVESFGEYDGQEQAEIEPEDAASFLNYHAPRLEGLMIQTGNEALWEWLQEESGKE